MTYLFQNFSNGERREEITDFLFTIKEELRLPDRKSAEKVTNLCYEHGGVIAIYDGNLLCALSGYFIGDPQYDFVNTDMGFMYVAGILPEYRRTRLFLLGLVYTLNEFHQMGLRTFRLQAEASNPYTNRLYARFANLTGQHRTLRGIVANSYEGNTEQALESLNHVKRPLSPTKKEPIHKISSNSQNHMLGLMG